MAHLPMRIEGGWRAAKCGGAVQYKLEHGTTDTEGCKSIDVRIVPRYQTHPGHMKKSRRRGGAPQENFTPRTPMHLAARMVAGRLPLQAQRWLPARARWG